MAGLSCLARNGLRPGEESRRQGVAFQTVEAQPVFGQIKPSKRQGVRVLNSIERRRERHRSYGTRGRLVFRWEKRERAGRGESFAEHKRTCKHAPI